MKHVQRSALLIFSAICIALTAGSTSFAQDPISAGPHIYKKVFENERVRIMEVTFAPGDSIGMHSHPDHAVYALKAGSLKIYEQGAKAMDVVMKIGDTAFLPAQSHSAKNVGKTEMKVLVVELKEPPIKKEAMKEEMK